MKKLLIVFLALLFVSAGYGQVTKKPVKDSIKNEGNTNGIVDSNAVKLPADTVEFISLSDMNFVMVNIGDQVTHNEYEKIRSVMTLVLKEALKRRDKKKVNK